MFDLSGKVALVTGASRGIGRAMALRLAAQGAHVVAAAREDHANATAAAIEEQGGRARAMSVDVTDSAALERLPGAIVGGLVIGIAEALAGFYLPEGFKDVAPYAVLLFMLAVRPNGLFGEAIRKRV